MKNIGLVTFFVLALMSVAVCGATRVKSCFVKDKTFPTSGLTHVDTHLETAEECQESCTDDCAGFTWINHNSSLLPKICALFNSTDTQIDCADCVSGPKECPCYFYGECEMTDDILVGVHEHVDDMASCHSLCKIWDNENCKHFTYYTGDSEFPQLCFLFSDCAKNNTDCDTDCVHGPKECDLCTWDETEDGTCSEYGGGAVAQGWGSTGNASTTPPTTTTTTTTTPTTTTITTTPTTTTTTTTPTTTITMAGPAPCRSYTELNQAWRKIDYGNRTHCSNNGDCHCDSNIQSKWYRFVEPAGTVLPTSFASPRASMGKEVCKTHGHAYLTLANPTIGDGIVSRNVCFDWRNSCTNGRTINVAACTDIVGRQFYVYQLGPGGSCSYAFCAL